MKAKVKRKFISTHDPVRNRLKQINRSLRYGLQLKDDGLWISSGSACIHLAVPSDMRQEVRSTLSGKGGTPVALARRLSSYGFSEWERRFANCFPEDEPDADRLTDMSDESWKVI